MHFCPPVMLAEELLAVRQPQTFLMNYTWNLSAIQKTSPLHFFCFKKKLLCKFISSIFDPFIIQRKWNRLDRSNMALVGDRLFTAKLRRATFVPGAVSSQIMRPVITIVIGFNKKWVMARGAFANSTQRMRYQGIPYSREGSCNLMKIQLAHFGNGLCTSNKISKKRWEIRAWSKGSLTV